MILVKDKYEVWFEQKIKYEVWFGPKTLIHVKYDGQNFEVWPGPPPHQHPPILALLLAYGVNKVLLYFRESSTHWSPMHGCSHWFTCSTVPGVYFWLMLSTATTRCYLWFTPSYWDMVFVSFYSSWDRTMQRIRDCLLRCGGIWRQGVLLSPSDDPGVITVFYTMHCLHMTFGL